MTTNVTRPCSTTQHQTFKTKTKTDFWSQTGFVLNRRSQTTSLELVMSSALLHFLLTKSGEGLVFVSHCLSVFHVVCTATGRFPCPAAVYLLLLEPLCFAIRSFKLANPINRSPASPNPNFPEDHPAFSQFFPTFVL